MKKIFENQGDAVRVLSNSAMKKVFGGAWPEVLADRSCRVHCMGWPQGQFVPVKDCRSAREVCKDENEEGEIDICHC